MEETPTCLEATEPRAPQLLSPHTIEPELRGKRSRCKERASRVALVVKNPPAGGGGVGDAGSIPVSGRFPREGRGNPLQFSCLENPLDRGAWRAAVHGVAESDRTEVT